MKKKKGNGKGSKRGSEAGGPAAVGVSIVSDAMLSSIDDFWFSVRKDAVVRPFDFVSVKDRQGGGRAIGIVDELRVAPWAAPKGGLPYSEEGVMVARAAILASTPGDKAPALAGGGLPVMPGRKVRLAHREEVLLALGVPKMANPVPAGIIEMSDGTRVPVALDVSYIAGPDTAHVNAAGISGSRKTSYLLFLLQSAYQKLSKDGKGGVSIVIFNTKEHELLQIDAPAVDGDGDKFGKEDREMFRLLGLDAEPFPRVIYYLPRGSDGRPNSSLVPKNSKAYSYELGDIHDRLELLFSHTGDPHYDGILSITNYLAEAWPVRDGGSEIRAWSDLARFTGYPEEVVAHRSTLVHFMAHLQRFRRSTLLVDRRKTSVFLGGEIKKIRAGDVFVVDIARLPTLEEQSLVVGDVMRAVDELHSAQNAAKTAGRYLIVFIDEINRFLPPPSPAPGARRMSAAAEQVMKTVIAGRSRNTALFSAQQFKSAADGALHENTGTHTFAKLGMAELAGAPYYSMLGDSIKKNIVRLNKGEVVMVHPAFRHPIKITFPRPAFKKQ
jgi:hypothetical protein